MRVVVWESETTGVRPPPLPAEPGAIGRLGEIAALCAGPVRATLHYPSGALTLWDAEARTAIVWFGAERDVPWWERAAPLRAALSHMLAGPGRQLVHAGAVGGARGAALVGGPAGSGKSTTCVACLERGLRFAGDDQVLLDAGGDGEPGGRPVAYGLHRTAKLEAGAVAALPAVRDAIWEAPAAHGADEERKTILLLRGARLARVAASLPLTHAVVPRIVDAERTEAVPLGRPAALRALAPSSVFSVPRDRGGQLAVLARALRRLECVELRLGRDRRAPEVLEALLGGAPA